MVLQRNIYIAFRREFDIIISSVLRKFPENYFTTKRVHGSIKNETS